MSGGWKALQRCDSSQLQQPTWEIGGTGHLWPKGPASVCSLNLKARILDGNKAPPVTYKLSGSV